MTKGFRIPRGNMPNRDSFAYQIRQGKPYSVGRATYRNNTPSNPSTRPSNIDSLDFLTQAQGLGKEQGVDITPEHLAVGKHLQGMGLNTREAIEKAQREGSLPKKAAAFTLIELLVVIAIIGALVAILTPALGKANKFAKETKCSTQLSQIGRGMHSYASDHKGYFPPTDTDGADLGSHARIRTTKNNEFGHGLLINPKHQDNLQPSYVNGIISLFACPEADFYTLKKLQQDWDVGVNADSSLWYRSFGHGRIKGPGFVDKGAKLSNNSVMIDYNKNFGATKAYDHEQRTVGVLYGDGHVNRYPNENQDLSLNSVGDQLLVWPRVDAK